MLNEMGVAWVTKAAYMLLLLSKFSFGDIQKYVDLREIVISFEMDDVDLQHRMN